MISTTLSLFVTIILLIVANSATDFSIYGTVGPYIPRKMDLIGRTDIYSKCFEGFHFLTCRAQNTDTDESRLYDLAYYHNFDDNYGDYYCLQCCGAARNIDIWQLLCEVDEYSAVESNVYGYSFIFAANDDSPQFNVIECPIKRSGCTYDEVTGLSVSCNTDDGLYLHGYSLTLQISFSHDNLQRLWRTVKSCEAVSIESTVPLQKGDMFQEEIIMVYKESSYTYDATQLFLISLVTILFVYLLVYYLRREHCVVCAKKLVVCTHRCVMCRFYGAEPPDPLLERALAEKGAIIQGVYPEKLPGAHVLTERVRKMNVKRVYVGHEEAKIDGGGEGSLEDSQSQSVSVGEQSMYDYRLRVLPHVLFSAVGHPSPPPPPQTRDLVAENAVLAESLNESDEDWDKKSKKKKKRKHKSSEITTTSSIG
mmetsp:Transcript_25214/g.25427  ORF Transcript_25214/g.25427 Transcript_25214/m.25427 type:complete len:423 (-) Transcript_25214:109-1377(-)